MGIEIGITVSTNIQERVWDTVYQESLFLAKQLNLASMETMDIQGFDVRCLHVTEESSRYGKRGWYAVGDYTTRDCCESFFFPAKLEEPKTQEPSDVLAIRAHEIGFATMECPGENWTEFWGNKTQGHDYHIPLLAIGCLVQDRLSDLALVHGYITAGQCRRAVELANQHLSVPIQVPDQCDPDRWFDRINRLPLNGTDRVRVAIQMFIGRKGAHFGNKLRECFPHDLLLQYWKEEFEQYGMGCLGYISTLKSYLGLGFDVAELCDIVPMQRQDGKVPYASFIKSILDCKLHWSEKDCSEWLEPDPEDPFPQNMDAIALKIFTLGVINHKADRYIPIEELRKILADKLSQKCDAGGIIDKYIAREKELENAETDDEKLERDPFYSYTELKDEYCRKREEQMKHFDILDVKDLMFYKPGERITPELQELLCKTLKKADSWTKEEFDTYQCETFTLYQRKLAFANASLYSRLLQEKDWEYFIGSLDEHPEFLEEYLSLMMLSSPSHKDPQNEAATALLLNRNLYDYCRTLIDAENQP